MDTNLLNHLISFVLGFLIAWISFKAIIYVALGLHDAAPGLFEKVKYLNSKYMKPVYQFLIGALVIYMGTRFAYMLPEIIGMPLDATTPILLRWMVGVVILCITAAVVAFAFKIGETIWEKFN